MTIEKAFPAMGTVHIITIFDAEGPGAANDARAYLLRLNQAWSCFQADSLISRINRAAGVAPVAVDEDTFAVLQQARRYGGLTDGAFDVTVGPLAQLWREAMERRQLPADGDVWQALQLVDWRSILLDEKGQTAMLHRPGQRIDLGGIAKGYAADGLRKFLRQHGVRRALLDLGGTVLSLGGRLPVGIRDPFRPAGATATSGSYERFIEIGGERFSHIIDPRSGYPSKSGLVSVTLVGENGAALDALATAALILGPERSVPLLTEQGMDAIFVTDQGQVLITRGLKNEFRLTNKTNTMSDGQVSVA